MASEMGSFSSKDCARLQDYNKLKKDNGEDISSPEFAEEELGDG
jgi:hypothetical protein